MGEYIHKSDKIYIEGKLQTSSWEDRNSGDRKYRTEIVARGIVLLGSRGTDANSEADGHDQERETVHAGAGEITDEDIPF